MADNSARQPGTPSCVVISRDFIGTKPLEHSGYRTKISIPQISMDFAIPFLDNYVDVEGALPEVRLMCVPLWGSEATKDVSFRPAAYNLWIERRNMALVGSKNPFCADRNRFGSRSSA
jgi:hypothetical protein